MLQNLQLQNFKNWKDTAPIKLAPLTVLFGTNSSGKSSIEQFLLMLKQTVDSSDRKLALFPGDVSTAVNLGSFEELIYGRDPRNKLTFSFGWQLPVPLHVKDPRSTFECVGNEMSFSAVLARLAERNAVVGVERFEYSLKKNGVEVMHVSLERTPARPEFKLEASPYVLTRNPGRVWPLGPPNKFYGFPDQIAAYFQNADFVQDFSLEIENLLRSISYLGPLRSKGQRLYYWTGGEPESVGFAGENTISALLAAKERKVKAGNAKYKPFHQLIAEKLKQLQLIDVLDIRQISSNRKEYEVKVKTSGSPTMVDLPDVGFGISQILPVIVQCFYAPAGSIIFIEQPELHLHPSAQALLVDLFIDVLNSRENGKDRNVQLIIETHSEHFLHRLQRRIAENSADHPISRSQVAAYFAKTTGSQSCLEELSIDEYGAIANWPENFFGDTMTDIFEMSKATARRQQERSQ